MTGMLGLFGSAAWQVLLWGVVFGAGLPAIFATGIRLLAAGEGGAAEDDAAPPRPAARVAGIVLMAVVVLAVLLALAFIVGSGLGLSISFEHGFPTFQGRG
ncbi:hypothetical protein GCM10011512_15880 [Tersicoccus solisilvae]|uniref:Uncharacterized protein n=1 Tax=Tersicoccus solisilvae TaxID=1882339 RepID=A0ABQ1P2A9_9MICC|nr:hypothetical protein [Tersicoccus solisilvae]GGC89744.1 hypothetical protein GCM10011512_15880 [Tersicoccus solisilvae]